MRIISNRALLAFAALHPDADAPSQAWRKVIQKNRFRHFADLKATFNSVDQVGNYYVFDIAGNRYRLVAAVHFNRQMLFIRNVLTHKAYDDWRP